MDFPEEMVAVKEVSKSVRKMEFDNSEDDISKVQILSVSSLASEPKDGRDFKVREKEASARYRKRKRMLDEKISAEISVLESTQRGLKEKHDKLQSEIEFLRNIILLREKRLLNSVHCPHESPNASVASDLPSSSSSAADIQVTVSDDLPSTSSSSKVYYLLLPITYSSSVHCPHESPDASVASDLPSSSSSAVDIQVTVSDDLSSTSSSSKELVIIEDDSKSEIKTEFVDIGDDNPNLNITVVDFPVPASNSKPRDRRKRNYEFADIGEDDNRKLKVTVVDFPVSSLISKSKDRRERKKVQNKQAAALYRFRRRMEEEEMSGEVSELVSTQKNLQKKHDELQFEIKCLKNIILENVRKKKL